MSNLLSVNWLFRAPKRWKAHHEGITMPPFAVTGISGLHAVHHEQLRRVQYKEHRELIELA